MNPIITMYVRHPDVVKNIEIRSKLSFLNRGNTCYSQLDKFLSELNQKVQDVQMEYKSFDLLLKSISLDQQVCDESRNITLTWVLHLVVVAKHSELVFKHMHINGALHFAGNISSPSLPKAAQPKEGYIQIGSILCPFNLNKKYSALDVTVFMKSS